MAKKEKPSKGDVQDQVDEIELSDDEYDFEDVTDLPPEELEYEEELNAMNEDVEPLLQELEAKRKGGSLGGTFMTIVVLFVVICGAAVAEISYNFAGFGPRLSEVTGLRATDFGLADTAAPARSAPRQATNTQNATAEPGLDFASMEQGLPMPEPITNVDGATSPSGNLTVGALDEEPSNEDLLGLKATNADDGGVLPELPDVEEMGTLPEGAKVAAAEMATPAAEVEADLEGGDLESPEAVEPAASDDVMDDRGEKVFEAEAPEEDLLTELAEEASGTLNDPSPRPDRAEDTGPEDFYEANPAVARGAERNFGPQEVNPKDNPASQFILVKKNFEGSNEQSLLVSAERAMQTGRYDAALDIYARLEKKNPRDQRVLMGKAVALQKLGNEAGAIQAYQAILNQDPENVDATLNMLGLMKDKYPEVALRQLLDLYARYPSNPTIVGQLGAVHAKIGNHSEALKYFGIAASLEPNKPTHYLNIAIISDRLDSNKQAVEYYEKALELDSIYYGGRSINRDMVYDRLSRIRSQ